MKNITMALMSFSIIGLAGCEKNPVVTKSDCNNIGKEIMKDIPASPYGNGGGSQYKVTFKKGQCRLEVWFEGVLPRKEKIKVLKTVYNQNKYTIKSVYFRKYEAYQPLNTAIAMEKYKYLMNLTYTFYYKINVYKYWSPTIKVSGSPYSDFRDDHSWRRKTVEKSQAKIEHEANQMRMEEHLKWEMEQKVKNKNKLTAPAGYKQLHGVIYRKDNVLAEMQISSGYNHAGENGYTEHSQCEDRWVSSVNNRNGCHAYLTDPSEFVPFKK